MARLTILQIIRGLDIGGDSGGAERFGLELSRELNRAGNRVIVCAFFRVNTDAELAWQKNLQEVGIETFFLVDWRGVNNLNQYMLGLKNLLSRLRGEKVDVTHSHFQLGSLTALILKILHKTKAAIRTAHIRHEWELGKNSWFLHNVFIKRLFPTILDAQVGVSQAVVNYLASLPGSKRPGKEPVLIYNAVSFGVRADKSHAPELIRRDPGDLMVISVGRLTEQKGYEYLLKAIPAVLESLPQAKFFIVGDGDLHKELINLAETLKITPYVNFMGLRSDVPYLLPQCDLFVLSSLWEGFPTVIMESMVSGTPVIATDIAGSRELINSSQNGWLVAPRNPEELASAINYALSHPDERNRVARQASEDVQKFFIDKICQDYIALYERLLIRNQRIGK